MAKLTIHEGNRSTVYEILEDSLVVGARSGSAIRVSDPGVSEEHCQITLVPGMGYKLIDLESRDGTKVNGAFVNQHLLREGDVIQIGNVRLSYTGAAPAGPVGAPAQAIPAAPAVARAVPAAPAYAPPAAARPAPPPRDREQRPPPMRRGRGGDSSGPIIVMGAMAGLLILIVIIVIIVNANSRMTPNEQIYRQMEQLIASGQYDGALALAEKADPHGDAKAFANIQLQKQAIRVKRAKQGGMSREYDALRAYQGVESWIQGHRHDIAGTITQWEEVVRAFPGTHWASKAQGNIDHLLAGGKNPEGITKYATGRATIDRAYDIAQATAKSFEEDDRFQDAIDTYLDFWEEYKLHTTDLTTWEGRIQKSIKGIEGRADSRWTRLDEVAKQYVTNGEYDAAIRLYRKIAERFGIEKYQYRAGEAMRKIQRD
jgi:tetratricopeptide (TPR) repeat protein